MKPIFKKGDRIHLSDNPYSPICTVVEVCPVTQGYVLGFMRGDAKVTFDIPFEIQGPFYKADTRVKYPFETDKLYEL